MSSSLPDDLHRNLYALRCLSQIPVGAESKDLATMVRFKLGDPEIIWRMARLLASRLKPLARKVDPTTVVVTGPPHNDGLPAARFFALAVARSMGWRAAFPVKCFAVSDYTLNLTIETRCKAIEGYCKFMVDLSGLSAVVIDDIISTGAMMLELSRQVTRAGGTVRAHAAIWDCQAICNGFERSLRPMLREFVATHKNEIVGRSDWIWTSSLSRAMHAVTTDTRLHNSPPAATIETQDRS